MASTPTPPSAAHPSGRREPASARAFALAETGPRSLGTLPFACAVITAINGLYILLVSFGNITDFGTNLEFVQHVLAMDTTNFGAEPGTALDPDVMWRAITSSGLQTAAYVAIIIWESATALVLSYATLLWARSWRSRSFAAPRRVATVGLLMLVILFMAGFIAIGGEWFQMWRSTDWNGIDAAFRNAVLALLGLILIHLPSPDWTEVTGPESSGMLSR